MKPVLCKAGQQMREQFDDTFPDRDRRSDGWIGDTRHSTRSSDHNPDWSSTPPYVRAIDVDNVHLDIAALDIHNCKGLLPISRSLGV